MHEGSNTPAERILLAWTDLERALRRALPACSVAPPTQPRELLTALRVNHRVGPQEEAEIIALREMRNWIAHAPEEPSPEEVAQYETRVATVMGRVVAISPEVFGTPSGPC